MTNTGVDAAATAAAVGGGGNGAAGSQPVVLLVGEHMARVSSRLEEFAELVRWPGGEGKEEEQKAILEKYGEKIRAIVGRYDCELPAVLYERLPKVEVISNFGVGVNNIDVARAKAKGVQVTNTPDVLTDDVADIALGLILCVSRRLCEADRYVRSGKWVQQGNMPLTVKVSGKTVGILGLGRIGQAIATRAEGFNCKIAYFSRKPKPGASPDYSYHPTPSSLAAASDFLVVACALTPETTHIVDAEVLRALGPRGVLINIGRGPHVDEPALVDALQRGIVGGAGLDVFEGEPEVPEALMKMENVVLLPHVGSATEETRNEMADLTVDNVRAQFEGKALLTPV